VTASDFQQAARAIRAADALVIAAGAGMGVDSGLPDFRGKGGFWKAYPVVARLGLSFAEMANPAWFENDPELAWAFYGHRLNLYRKTVPHAGFATLLEWARKKPAGYFVFTSNVDGHFQKAGFPPEQIEECHGSIHHFQCLCGCTRVIWDASEETVAVDETHFRAARPLPQCRHCGGMARPNIMMFNDFSWLSDRSNGQQKCFTQWLQQIQKKSARLAVVELGAGTAIPSVRLASERLLARFGGTLIRINPRECTVPPGHFGLATGALQGLQLLEAAMKNGKRI
jgi:NAD-dependent SIR2 family protein deacetylase